MGRTHAHTQNCDCDNYISLTASGLDKNNLQEAIFFCDKAFNHKNKQWAYGGKWFSFGVQTYVMLHHTSG